MIKVALVEDNRELRENMERLFSIFEEIELIFSVEDGAEAIRAVNTLEDSPDVILMDIEMRDIDGITATSQIKKDHPEIKILMLSVFDQKEKVKAALSAGADGYLLKGEKPMKILDLIKEAVEGRLPMSPDIAQKTRGMFRAAIEGNSGMEDFGLTRREKEVLEQLVIGRTYQEIGEYLHISPLTVRTHMENLYRKLKVHNKAEAIGLALKNSWF